MNESVRGSDQASSASQSRCFSFPFLECVINCLLANTYKMTFICICEKPVSALLLGGNRLKVCLIAE